MNYYERYCGDYQRDTATLSLVEHGAYTQLLDTYYATEMPLPAEKVRLYRVCRAVSADEQAAVDFVVEQYFPIGPDGLRHNARADAEIEKARTRIETARANGKGGGRKPANPAGGPPGNPPGNPVGNPPGNPAETQREARRGDSPDPIPHTPPSVLTDGTRAPGSPQSGTKAGEACRLMKAAGIGAVNPSDPELLQLLSQGVTPQQFGDLAAELRDAQGRPPSARYVIRAMAGRLRDAANAPPVPNAAANPYAAFAGWQRDDGKAVEFARHLGMGEGRPGESFEQLRSRIRERLARQKEAA